MNDEKWTNWNSYYGITRSVCVCVNRPIYFLLSFIDSRFAITSQSDRSSCYWPHSTPARAVCWTCSPVLSGVCGTVSSQCKCSSKSSPFSPKISLDCSLIVALSSGCGCWSGGWILCSSLLIKWSGWCSRWRVVSVGWGWRCWLAWCALCRGCWNLCSRF